MGTFERLCIASVFFWICLHRNFLGEWESQVVERVRPEVNVKGFAKHIFTDSDRMGVVHNRALADCFMSSGTFSWSISTYIDVMYLPFLSWSCVDGFSLNKLLCMPSNGKKCEKPWMF